MAVKQSTKEREHVMRWWVGDDPNQITIDDYLKMTGEI